MKLTTAQKFLMAIGLDPQRVLLSHQIGRTPHCTKKGPGRKHQQGK